MKGLLYFRNHTKLGSPNSVEPQQYDEIEIDLTRSFSSSRDGKSTTDQDLALISTF